MKKYWKEGQLMMIIGALAFMTVMVFSGEIHIQEWPLPLTLSRVIVIACMIAPIVLFVIGFRRYNASKKQGKASKFHPLPVEEKAPESAKPASGSKTEAEKAAYLKETFCDKSAPADLPKEMLNDVSFIQDMRHTQSGAWQQYDFLLASQGYGWEYMLSWADYMTKADLENIGTVTVAEMANMKEKEMLSEYEANGNKFLGNPAFEYERGQLGVGGMSRALNFYPVKILWFNQTRAFRIYTIPDDEELITRYAETMIRRTFGTSDAMKLAKPVKKAEKKTEKSPDPAEPKTEKPAEDAGKPESTKAAASDPGSLSETVSSILAEQKQRFDTLAQGKAPKEPASEEMLLGYFAHYFAPNEILYSEPGSDKYNAYFNAINAAREELLRQPRLFSEATKWTAEELAALVNSNTPGITQMKICGLIFMVGNYSVIKDAVYCVDFSEMVPNCIALYLLLTAQKLPAEKRTQVIDAGEGTDTKPLTEAMDALKVCDPSWNYKIW